MSKNTALVADALGALTRATRADIASDVFAPGLLQHLLKLAKVLRALGVLVIRRLASTRCLYAPSAAGPGMVHTTAMVLLALVLGYRVFLHHRSFSYIDAKSWRMALLARIGGGRVVHVFLCDCMRDLYVANYPQAENAIVVSNATHIEPVEELPPAALQGLRLGHMSNLCEEKGLDTVLAVTRRLVAAGLDVKLVLAGPPVGPKDTEKIDLAKAELGEVLEYRGPVYGADKIPFFSDIDVFLFPSMYAHEAQPNVVFEAMAFGVPTVSYARSCIAEVLADGGGIAIPTDEDFVAGACSILEAWNADPRLLAEARRRALADAVSQKRRADVQFEAFIRLLSGLEEHTHESEKPADTADAPP